MLQSEYEYSRARGRGEQGVSRLKSSGCTVPLGDSTPDARSSANCCGLLVHISARARTEGWSTSATSATSAASDSLHEGESSGYSNARGRILSAVVDWSEEVGQGDCPKGVEAATTACPIISASSSASKPNFLLLSVKLCCARRRRTNTQRMAPDKQRDTTDMLPTAAVMTPGSDASSQSVRPTFGCCPEGHRVHTPKVPAESGEHGTH